MASQHVQDAGIVVPVDDPEYGRMLQRLYCAADTWFFLGAHDTQIERLAAIPGLQAVQGLTGAPLAAQLAECFRAKPADAWVRLLVEAGMGAHTLSTVAQLMQDPWAVAHGLSVTRQHRDGSLITTIGPPARLSRTPAVPGRPVPLPLRGQRAPSLTGALPLPVAMPRKSWPCLA